MTAVFVDRTSAPQNLLRKQFTETRGVHRSGLQYIFAGIWAVPSFEVCRRSGCVVRSAGTDRRILMSRSELLESFRPNRKRFGMSLASSLRAALLRDGTYDNNDAVHNALVESFAIHCRALYCFFSRHWKRMTWVQNTMIKIGTQLTVLRFHQSWCCEGRLQQASSPHDRKAKGTRTSTPANAPLASCPDRGRIAAVLTTFLRHALNARFDPKAWQACRTTSR